jgi:nitrogen fixation protein FixH
VRRDTGITGRHVLLALIAFFGAIFAVNGVLLWQALSTHSGLVAHEPYRKGLAYNQRIAADERQEGLAWTPVVEIERRGAIAVTLSDAEGRPVTGLRLDGTIGRPATMRQDISVRLEERSPGRYVAHMAALEPGAWIVGIEARLEGAGLASAGDAPIYRLRRRLWLDP